MLLYNEGKAGELIQYVRVTRTTTEDRTFTYVSSGSYVDFGPASRRSICPDVLRYSFPGSPPDRTFGRNATKTLIRDTTVADAATYYGASPTVLVGAIGDTAVKVGHHLQPDRAQQPHRDNPASTSALRPSAP